MDDILKDINMSEALNKYIELYKSSEMPVAVLDRSLRIVWSNDFIITNYKAMSNNNYLHSILSQEQKDDIITAIDSNEFITIDVYGVTSFLATVSFAPIYTITNEERNKTKNVEKNKKSGLICVFFNMSQHCTRNKIDTIVGFESKVRCALANVFTSVNAIQNRSSQMSDCDDMDIFLKQITKSTYQVLKVMGTLSSYSKIINGANKCNFEVVNCSEFFDNLLYAIKAIMFQSGVEINYTRKIDNDVYFSIDKEKIKRLILQLISMSFDSTVDRQVSKMTVLKVQDLGENIVMDFVFNNITTQQIFGEDDNDKSDADTVIKEITKKIMLDTIYLHSGDVEVISEQNKKTIIRGTLPCFRMQQEIGNTFFSSYDKSENLMMDKFSSLYIELSDLL